MTSIYTDLAAKKCLTPQLNFLNSTSNLIDKITSSSDDTVFVSKNNNSKYTQVRISPIFDAHFGIPTASVAESRKRDNTKDDCFNSQDILIVNNNLKSNNNSSKMFCEVLDNTNEKQKLNFKDSKELNFNYGAETFLKPNTDVITSNNNNNKEFLNEKKNVEKSAVDSVINKFYNNKHEPNKQLFLASNTPIICQNALLKDSSKTKDLTNYGNTNLEVASIASAIVAAAVAQNKNSIKQKNSELINILNVNQNLIANQNHSENETNFKNFQEFLSAQEQMRTSINVHQILGQSIANANSNDLFKSATTTMAANCLTPNSQTSTQTLSDTKNQYSDNQYNFSSLDNTEFITSNLNYCSNKASSSLENNSSSAFRPVSNLIKQTNQYTFQQNKLIPSKMDFQFSNVTNVIALEKPNTTIQANNGFVVENENFKLPLNFNEFVAIALDSLIQNHESNESTASTSTLTLNNSNGEITNSLLCQVCSDKASGFHYGINSCEGCKGFFRRSLNSHIEYKKCTKNQQCLIVRSNRNRCQDCRFKKCLAVGMSRDAVRFGRVPKREKLKMAEEQQRATIRSQIDALTSELESETTLITSIENGFFELGDKICKTLKLSDINRKEIVVDEFIYYELMQAVVNFTKSIRSFDLLYKKNCFQLLKNSIFQVLLLRLLSIKVNFEVFDNLNAYEKSIEYIDATKISQIILLSNYSRCNMSLFNSTIDFIQRFRLLKLDDRQCAIFSALIICQPDGSGSGLLSTATHSQQARLLKMLQQKLWIVLQSGLFPNPQLNPITGSLLNQSLFAAFTELRTLNLSHQEHLKNISIQNLDFVKNLIFDKECVKNKNLNQNTNFNATNLIPSTSTILQNVSTDEKKQKIESCNAQTQNKIINKQSSCSPLSNLIEILPNSQLHNCPQSNASTLNSQFMINFSNLPTSKEFDYYNRDAINVDTSELNLQKINQTMNKNENLSVTPKKNSDDLPTLRRVLEQPPAFLPPPAKKLCKLEDLCMTKMLHEHVNNFNSINESQKETSLLLINLQNNKLYSTSANSNKNYNALNIIDSNFSHNQTFQLKQTNVLNNYEENEMKEKNLKKKNLVVDDNCFDEPLNLCIREQR